MNVERKNCRICGVELVAANSFTCPNCKRTDICILHKGNSSGLCSECLDRFRKRLIYPTFIMISLVMLVFSTYLFKTISLLVFPLVLFLPFWLMIELSRPVITFSKLKKILLNIIVISIVLMAVLVIGWNLWLTGQYIRVISGMAQVVFLMMGILLLLLGFVYILSTSLKGIGISFFNYDYPEEYSLMLKKAGGDPEMITTLKWDLKWITVVNFIYGIVFLSLYLSSTG